MFVGREHEIEAMRETLKGNRRPSQAILVFGKKGTGKTALVQELLKDTPHKTVWFKAEKHSVVDSTQDLAKACVEAGVIPPGGEYRDFEDLFEEISDTPGTYNIVIDDYHNIGYKEKQEYRDSVFQCSIDMYMQLCFKKHPGTILLFLIGTGYQMRKLRYYSMPLYGRMDRCIRLQDLSYKEAAAFYTDYSPQDKLLMYSAFGGSPRMNMLVNPSLSAEDNIIALLKGKELDRYARDMLRNVRDNARRDPEIHAVLKALADGDLFLMSRVPAFLHEDVCPYMLKRHMRILDELNDADLLKECSYEQEEDTYTDKTYRYEFRDMTLRFWYRHLYGNRPLLDKLGAEEFYGTQIASALYKHLERVFEMANVKKRVDKYRYVKFVA